MADDTTSNPTSAGDAVGASPEDPRREQTDYDTWLSEAHAPGDPPPPQLSHAEVGTD